MANPLYPNQNEKNKGRNSVKFKLDCQDRISGNRETTDWLELTNKFNHTSADFKIYIGLLEKRKHIVAKIGPRKLDEEYIVANKLEELELPTFLAFDCIFRCLDNFSKINATTKKICKETGDSVTVIIMPYLNEGRIDQWAWKRDNFNLMKNLLKHICLSLLYASKTLGYVHNDLHLGNVLLKKTQKKQITYGDFGSLEVMGIIPVIMDYEDSVFNFLTKSKIYNDIANVIYLMGNQNVQYGTDNFRFIIAKLFNNNVEITMDLSKMLCNEIDNLQIITVLSEKPPTPNWLKPIKK